MLRPGNDRGLRQTAQSYRFREPHPHAPGPSCTRRLPAAAFGVGEGESQRTPEGASGGEGGFRGIVGSAEHAELYWVSLLGCPRIPCYNMRSAIRSLAVTRLKIRQIGNSQGVLLPKDLLGEANAQLGDEMIATVKSNGVIELKPAGPDADDLMKTARGIMAKRRKVLRALAK